MRTLHADVVIVGAGAAGATLAATLAEHTSLKIVLVEQGGHFGREFFNQNVWEMTQALYAGKGVRSTDDGAIVVRGGECVGGGTTVNIALSFDPVERVWRHWRERFGVEGFSFDADASDYGMPGLNMRNCLAEVRARLNVQPVDDREINANNALFGRGCAALGIVARKFELNMRGCIGCGFCSSGCAYDAKRGALVTYVPDAVARGVTLIHHARVERILHSSGVARGVELEVGATRPGSRANSVAPGPLQIDAKLVLLSAGAIESPCLLQRSAHPDPHRRVGRGLVLHPSLPFVGRSPSEVAGHTGIEGSMYSDHFAQSDGFYFECLFGNPIYGASILPGVGVDHFEIMRSYRRLFGFGAMLIDDSQDENSVRWDRARGRSSIAYRLTDRDAARLRKAARIGIEIVFAAGGEVAWLPSEESLVPGAGACFRSASEAVHTQHLRFSPHATVLTSAHAQATLKMGSDVRRSVLNSRGETHGLRNLVVCDASVFPTSCGVNPMISIITLARYQGRRIAAEAARYGL